MPASVTGQNCINMQDLLLRACDPALMWCLQSTVGSQMPPPSLPEKKTSNQGELIAKMHLVEKHIRKNKLQVGLLYLTDWSLTTNSH